MNNLLMLFIFVPVLVLILLILNLGLAPHRPDAEKTLPYECGFNGIQGQTRSTFQIHFFLVALLFLIFDLELLLLFPIAVTLYQVGTFGFVVALVFFVILTIGFVLEIGSEAINLISFNTGESIGRSKK
jgi:NADH-ubiquinone oxidoreductase chain 3